MDKAEFNNEIILCRSIIKKVKVHTIRKIIKKINILKKVKLEKLKDKKGRKVERLKEHIQLIKKLRDDDVTKFALKTEELTDALNAEANSESHALAMLSKHPDVRKKVKKIRKKMTNWKEELPGLLEKKKKKEKKPKEAEQEKSGIEEDSGNESESEEEENSDEEIRGKKKKKRRQEKVKLDSEDSAEDELKVKLRSDKVKKKKKGKSEKFEMDFEDVSEEDEPKVKLKGEIVKKKKFVPKETIVVEEEKVFDPFFVNKKILPPKLVVEVEKEEEEEINKNDFFQGNKMEKRKFGREFSKGRIDGRFKGFGEEDRKRFDVVGDRSRRKESGDEGAGNRKERRGAVQEKEELHPSWTAKKVKLIQPFQGKKTIFTED